MTSTDLAIGADASAADGPTASDAGAGHALGLVVRTLFGTLVLAGTLQLLTAGYNVLSGEQMLLSLKGISWADSDALVNDWFNDSAPQPHVLFDIITWFGESLGVLDIVYLGYWLASLAVVALATAVLADHWLPAGLRRLELVVLFLVAAGPYFALGTFLVLHREGVPNALGGALGYLAAACLIRSWWRWAAIVALAATVVHVQHGVVVGFLLVVAWVLSSDRRQVRWFPFVVGGIVLMTLAVSVGRGLFAGNTDFTEICTMASPGHCNPQVWPDVVIRDGLVLLLVGACAPLLAPKRTRVSMWLIAAPAVLVAGGLAADLWGIPFFADLSRRLFVYRFVMVVAPFVGWTIVLLLVRSIRGRWRDLGAVLVGVVALRWWFGAVYAAIPGASQDIALAHRIGAAAGVVIAALVGVAEWWGRRAPVQLFPARVIASVLSVALVVGGTWVWAIDELDQTEFSVHELPTAPRNTVGRSIEEALPVGSVVAVAPDLSWFPSATRRAVVGTCKNVPYGGEPWREYRERLAALGVEEDYGNCPNEGWMALTADDVLSMRDRFGATHVLLVPGTPLTDEVGETWTWAWAPAGASGWVIAEIPDGDAP